MPALPWRSAVLRQRATWSVGLAICVAALFAGLLSIATAPFALAGPDLEEEEILPTDPIHRSHMVVPADGPFPVRQKITIGVDKSMLIELPVDLQNVLVSNPEVIDAVVQTSRQVYLLAKDLGEANAFFIGPTGEKVLFLEVSVTRDLTALQDMLRRLLPGSSVSAEMMGETVVLSGMVATPADANRAAELAGRFIKKKDGVVNLLGTNSKEQVLLKVQVAEMQRDALRRFGIDVADSLLQGGNFSFAKVIRNGFPITGSAIAESAVRTVGAAPFVSAGSALASTWGTGEQSITGLVQALERAGVLKTLAAPTLTAISGEQAKFLAGGEFPIPVAQDDNKITVDFKPFGINVSFRPVVLDEGRISLTISAEVSEITNEGGIQLRDITLPGLKVRRAETTLELPSGGTLAMAGLLSDDVRQSIEGVPGLKELPVLGALFRSQDYRRRETELVILVTPFLAKHAAHGQLAKPIDGYAPASGLRQLFFGHINRVYGISAPAEPNYHGDYGFIIDYPGVKG